MEIGKGKGRGRESERNRGRETERESEEMLCVGVLARSKNGRPPSNLMAGIRGFRGERKKQTGKRYTIKRSRGGLP